MRQTGTHGGTAGKREVACSYVHFLVTLVVIQQHATEK